MLIHVRKSKSRQDRYVILSKAALATLTEYWQKCGKPTGILFPSRWTGDYLSPSSVEQKLRDCVKKTSITKRVTPHSLRHTFATHLMEDGVEIRFIQALLGHRDPRSTEIYLHISKHFMICCFIVPLRLLKSLLSILSFSEQSPDSSVCCIPGALR